jgi:hypothetical protein
LRRLRTRKRRKGKETKMWTHAWLVFFLSRACPFYNTKTKQKMNKENKKEDLMVSRKTIQERKKGRQMKGQVKEVKREGAS